MEDNFRRQEALEQIRQNILQYGHHIYVVSGGPEPRYAYTIGLHQRFGAELIMAGSIVYMYDEVVEIINSVAPNVGIGSASSLTTFEVPLCGSVSMRSVDASWTNMMMLGAFDFYQSANIPAFQIIPDDTHWTLDIPNMSVPWNPIKEPAWRWLKEPWQYPVPKNSKSVTNLAALRGEQVTEAMRWEEDEWELFAGAGPDVLKDEIRIVPIGTLIALDQSLMPIMNLSVGSGLWRADASIWHPWQKSG